MNDQQYKKIMRLFTVAWFSVLFVLLILILLSSRGEAKMRQYIDEKIQTVSLQQAKVLESLPEPRDGYTPIKGVDYFDGRSGTNGTNTTSIHTEKTIVEHTIEQVPIKGEDGRTLEVQVNPLTNDFEKRYVGDEFWQILIPCEKLLTTCEVKL